MRPLLHPLFLSGTPVRAGHLSLTDSMLPQDRWICPQTAGGRTERVLQRMISKKRVSYAKYGWYRYDVRFALPVYNDKSGEIERYSIYKSVMLVRHAEDDKKYLYDFLSIKKETSSPLES